MCEHTLYGIDLNEQNYTTTDGCTPLHTHILLKSSFYLQVLLLFFEVLYLHVYDLNILEVYTFYKMEIFAEKMLIVVMRKGHFDIGNQRLFLWERQVYYIMYTAFLVYKKYLLTLPPI